LQAGTLSEGQPVTSKGRARFTRIAYNVASCSSRSWFDQWLDPVTLEPEFASFWHIFSLNGARKTEGNAAPLATAINHLNISNVRRNTSTGPSPNLYALAAVN
jgi:hypothetical protein